MKYILLSLLIASSITAKPQNGKIVEMTKLNASADSIFDPPDRSRPDYPVFKKILDSMVDVYHIIYLSDSLKVIAYLDVPKKPGKYPCIIYNHGGNREGGKINKHHYMGSLAQMCSYGYCVIASQYRGVDGGEGAEEFGGKDLDDVLNLIPLLSHVEKADTSRIGMWGGSRGAMMTYLSLTKTNILKAAVTVSGFADLKKAIVVTTWADTMFYNWLPAYRTNKEQWIAERSPLLFADKICKTTPIFIIQGTADDRVPTEDVLDLAKKFYELKQPFRLSVFEGGTHIVGEFYDEKMEQIKTFFDTYLRDGKKWPSLDIH